jgi:ABC-type glycerol-3-phosphate transport system substrate-binding protein
MHRAASLDRAVARALLLLLVAGVLAGCGGGSASSGDAGAQAAPHVTSISSVLELRAAFNEDRGRPRLLLILSPT